ncbi:MAG: hypothetical protein ACUVT8_06195 [Armatimonadota bacterium]
MLKRMSLAVLATLLLMSIAVYAYGWTKLGTCGFTTTPSLMRDFNRIRFNSIAFDGFGNIYATCCNANNDGMPGGLTIFQPDGTKIADVNLNDLGYPGAITKLVTGGDGVVYALQNWLEINWSFAKGVNRILAILPNGGVVEVWNSGEMSDANRIGGLTVGSDGNLYWTTNGANYYWKHHFFWRYDVGSGTVEESPKANFNTGWSETHRMFDLEFLETSPDGYDFGVISAQGTPKWRIDPMSWVSGRESGRECNPGWGRDWVTAAAYDPVNDVLWVGGRGGGSGPWSWYASYWGNSTPTPPDSNWSVVDLGDGNKGLQINKGTDFDAYFRLNGNYPTLTAAARFRVESYTGNYNGNTILNLRGVETTDGIPWPLFKVKNGYFRLEFVSASTAVDIAPVDNQWHEVRIITNGSTNKVTCYWDGQVIFDAQPNGLRQDTTGFFCFGATTRESNIYTGSTATVTFDWVRYANAAVMPGDAWPSGLGWYLDGSGDPTAFGSTCIMSYFKGNDGPGFFPVQRCFSWHANGNDPSSSGISNGGRYWISAIACNPEDGKAWMSWCGEINYNYDTLGAVWTRAVVQDGISPLGYEGVPEPGAQTVALGFYDGKVYALVCNMTTGEYSVYYKTTEPQVMSIAEAKQAPPGTSVSTGVPKPVTFPAYEGFSDYFYIEDENRISGIKVIPSPGQPVAKVGESALVKGMTGVQEGEAVIFASEVVVTPATETIEPLGMNGHCIGGLPLGIQPVTLRGGSEASQWPDNLNTTGLLVRIAGTLRVDTSSYPFVYKIDDGSGYPIRLVYEPGISGNDGDKVIVTGIAGVAWDGANGFRVLLLRSSDDVRILGQ